MNIEPPTCAGVRVVAELGNDSSATCLASALQARDIQQAGGSKPAQTGRHQWTHVETIQRSFIHCIEMTTASPPKLSIRPVRFAAKCMMTPFSFFSQRSPPLVLPKTKP